MSCREYEQVWQDWLDARRDGAPPLTEALEAHVSRCPSCVDRGRQFAILSQAIGALGPPASPSHDLADRILERRRHERESDVVAVRFAIPPMARWAVAAAVLVASLLGLRTTFRRNGVVEPPVLHTQREPIRPLTDSLAEATSETWNLALESSAPAARLGQSMLLSASSAEPSLSLPDESAAAGEVLQAVGGRVVTGVRPLSGTARRAFGFLLPSGQSMSPEPPQPPTRETGPDPSNRPER